MFGSVLAVLIALWPAPPERAVIPADFATGTVVLAGESGTQRVWQTNTLQAIRNNAISELVLDSPGSMRVYIFGFDGPAEIGPRLSLTLIWDGDHALDAPADRVFLTLGEDAALTRVAPEGGLSARVVAAAPRPAGDGLDVTIDVRGTLCMADEGGNPVDPCASFAGRMDGQLVPKVYDFGPLITFGGAPIIQ